MKPIIKFLGGSNRTETVKRNAIGSILIKGWSILISLILVPMTMDYLSPELYGIWLTISSVIIWLNFFDVGLTLGLKNKLAETLAVGDMQFAKTLTSTTYVLMFIIFVPLGLCLELIVPYINWSSFLNVSSDLNDQLIGVMRILVFCFALQMIFNTITAILAAYQKTAISNLFPVLGNTISVIIIYVLTKTVPPSLINLSKAISYIPAIILIVSSIILFKTKLRVVSPELKYFDKRAIKSIFNLGAKFFLLQIQVVVFYQTTNILISNISSPEQVTSYNIAYKYLSIASMIYTIILAPLWPAFTDAYAKRDYDWMKRTYRNMTRLYYIILILTIFMVIMSPIAYQLWIRTDSLVPIIMTLSTAIYVAANAWDSLQMYLINGIGAITIQTYVTFIGMILHIPLSLFLGKFVGGVGVVWSMTIISLIYAPIFTYQLRVLLKGKHNSIWNR